MNKINPKKINVAGAVIGVTGLVFCIISLFISEDSIKTGLVKTAAILIMVDVIVFGIITRIIQVKYVASKAKRIIKKSTSISKGDSDNYIDPATGALKKTEEQSVKEPAQAPYSYNAPREYSKVFIAFNMILIISFLLVMIAIPILFAIQQHIAGAILVGCGLLDVVIFGSVNTYVEKKSLRRRHDEEDKKNDVSDSNLSDKEVSVQLVEADVSDAEVILEMQKIAFAELLNKYEDYDTSPANETLGKVTSRFEDPNTYHYFIKAKEENVGVLRVVDSKTEEKKRLAQIFVMPEYRRNGYAYAAIKAVEDIHGATGWELDTILQERHLLKLYLNLGYSFKNKTQTVNSQMTLVFLEK